MLEKLRQRFGDGIDLRTGQDFLFPEESQNLPPRVRDSVRKAFENLRAGGNGAATVLDENGNPIGEVIVVEP